MISHYKSALLAVIFTAIVLSAQAQKGLDVSLDVSIDPLKIADKIEKAVNSNASRKSFVKNLMESTFQAAGREYNVMVFNLAQDYDDNFNDVVFYGSGIVDDITFGIWAFRDGEFTNSGDGDYINWAFRGWYDRDEEDDKHIIFHDPTKDESKESEGEQDEQDDEPEDEGDEEDQPEDQDDQEDDQPEDQEDQEDDQPEDQEDDQPEDQEGDQPEDQEDDQPEDQEDDQPEDQEDQEDDQPEDEPEEEPEDQEDQEDDQPEEQPEDQQFVGFLQF